ncbi:MAG TPA: ABC transporter permease [Thermomicrobiales bacterium]|nr:ABC transporter permease [Thermomicrobiales bacterium]
MSGFAGRARGATVWALAGLLVLFLGVPVGALVVRALGAGESWDARTYETLRQALGLSVATTAVTMVVVIALGTPLAYLLARRRFPGSAVVEALVDLPIVLPPAVAGIALLVAFGRNGLVGAWLADGGLTLGFTTTAVVMAQLFVSAPFYVIAARAGFARVDQDLEAAAADLGAPPGRVLRTVTLPLIAPSLIAGAVLAWARALGEFGATIMFAGNFPGVTQTMPLAIYGRFGAGDLPTALLLSVVLLVASLTVLLGVRIVGTRVREGI